MAQNPFSDPSYGADLAPPPDQSANPFADPNFGTPPKRRTLAAIANDTVIEVANAAAGGVSSVANFIRPGNSVSGWIDKNIVKAGENSQSDVVKDEKQRFRQGVAGAEGAMDELGAVGPTWWTTQAWLLPRRSVLSWCLAPQLRAGARWHPLQA